MQEKPVSRGVASGTGWDVGAEGVKRGGRLEEHAREVDDLDRLRDRQISFVAVAAHELRAPATVLYGIATTLVAKGGDLGGDQQSILHRQLQEQSSRLVRLTDQLLDLSLLDADAVHVARRPVDVRGQIEELVRSVAGERAGEVELEVDPGLEAELDPDAFDRIVGNLVANALRHGAAPVRVRAEQSGRSVCLTVEDCGAGVPTELRERLFERFVREGHAGSMPVGAGLGLAIAQQYALAQGGRIVYEPGEPRGARFQVVLPVG
jgi:two-component system, OmpR family, sensor histidine kinase MtrB